MPLTYGPVAPAESVLARTATLVWIERPASPSAAGRMNVSVKPSTPRSGDWKTARPSRTRALYVPTTTLRCTTLSTTTPS